MFWKKKTFLKTSFIKKDVRTTGGPILSRDRVVDSLWPKKQEPPTQLFFFSPVPSKLLAKAGQSPSHDQDLPGRAAGAPD
jgi:hypothetical protein